MLVRTLLLVTVLMALVANCAVCGQDLPVPWRDGPRDETAATQSPLSDPRDLLRLYGIDESQLDNVVDGEPAHPGDEETLAKMLYRLPSFPRDQLSIGALGPQDLAQAAATPAAFRGRVFRVSGSLDEVTVEQLLPEAAERFAFSQYYRVTLEVANAPFRAIVYARSIPAAWQLEEVPKTRSGALGMFLKRGIKRDDTADLIFVATRLAWYPDQRDAQRGIGPDLVRLANWGFDASLFDDVRPRNRQPLGNHERECFYELLQTVKRAGRGLDQTTNKRLDVKTLLLDPQSHHGDLLTVQGTARRVTQIALDEAAAQRWGLDHYFEIDLFVPLGDEAIRLGEDTEDRKAPTFTNNYPVTVCVTSLPENLPVSEDLSEEVRISAVFFKLWAYRSQFVSSFDSRQLQISPLLIGHAPRIVVVAPRDNSLFGIAAGLLFVALLAGLWYGLWMWTRSDRRFREKVVKRQRFDSSR